MTNLPEGEVEAVELLPCPFCGGSNLYTSPDEWGSGGQWVPPIHTGCKDCAFDLLGDDEDDAIANWNRRSRRVGEGGEGWVLVPREPTKAMQAALTGLGRAMIGDAHERDQWCWFAVKAYRAMIAAAPPHPQDSKEEEG